MTEWTIYTDNTPIGILTASLATCQTKVFPYGSLLQTALESSYQKGVIVAGNFTVNEETVKRAEGYPKYLYFPTYPTQAQGLHIQYTETNWLTLANLLAQQNYLSTRWLPFYADYNAITLNEGTPEELYEKLKFIRKPLTAAFLYQDKGYVKEEDLGDSLPVKNYLEEEDSYIKRALAYRFQFIKDGVQYSVIKADRFMHEVALMCQLESQRLGYKSAVFVQNGNFVIFHTSPEVSILDELGVENLQKVGNTYSFMMDSLNDNILAEGLRSIVYEA